MPPEEKMNWDADKGQVTLQKGEDTKTFDLSKEEDRVSFMKLGQRGWYFDSDASKELGELRKWRQNWDTAYDAAKKDPEARKEFVQKLNLAFGDNLFSLSDEIKNLKKNDDETKILMDDEENAKVVNMFKDLRKEITDLKTAQETNRREDELRATEVEVQKIEAEADVLEKKYDGKDGSPKFARKEVYAFAAENKIDNLETAFKMLHFEKLTEHAKKKAIKEYQDQIKKREGIVIETGDASEEFKISPKSKAKTYHQFGQEVAKTAKEQGVSFYKDED